ncbi:docking protein 3 [Lissotriton helveticus]
MDSLVKEGVVYQQHHILGKKCWKKTRAQLFGASPSGVARIETYEVRDGSAKERTSMKKSERRVLRLADCVSIVAAGGGNCPKGTHPFYFTTTDKTHVLAAEDHEEWVAQICQLAFQNPRQQNHSQESVQVANNGTMADITRDEVIIKDNSIYSSWNEVCEFQVKVQQTEASERCQLHGRYWLELTPTALQLKEDKSRKVLYAWPYHLLRKIGGDEAAFYIESGRRCPSGEGLFMFRSSQGCEIHNLVTSKIKRQQDITHDATFPASPIFETIAPIDYYCSGSWGLPRGDTGLRRQALEEKLVDLSFSGEMEDAYHMLDISGASGLLTDTFAPGPAAKTDAGHEDPLYAVVSKVKSPVPGQEMTQEPDSSNPEEKLQVSDPLYENHSILWLTRSTAFPVPKPKDLKPSSLDQEWIPPVLDHFYDNPDTLEVSQLPRELPDPTQHTNILNWVKPTNCNIHTMDHQGHPNPIIGATTTERESVLVTPTEDDAGQGDVQNKKGDGSEGTTARPPKNIVNSSFKNRLTTLLTRELFPKEATTSGFTFPTNNIGPKRRFL